MLSVAVASLLGTEAGAPTFQGPPDWRPPEDLRCFGIPKFPNGVTIEDIRHVYGMSGYSYIFARMLGARSIYHFLLGYEPAEGPKADNELSGEVTIVDTFTWSHEAFEIRFQVLKWPTN